MHSVSDEPDVQDRDIVSATPASGAGLYSHPTRDSFPRWAGTVTGLAALLLTAVFAGTLYTLNPAFQTGAAAGAPDQLGPTPAPAADIAAEAGTDAAAARMLMGQKGCGGCHVIPGMATAKGAVGPSLAGVGGRKQIAGGAVPHNGIEDMVRWLLDPQALKPGTAMPNLNLTEEEARTMAAYLETLR